MYRFNSSSDNHFYALFIICNHLRIFFKSLNPFFVVRTSFKSFLSVRISSFYGNPLNLFYLWESLLLFYFIYFFLSLYENNPAYEYHHLKQIFYHQNTIMIFLLTSYVPFSCFLFWILLILCLVTFLFSKVFSYSFNSTAIFTPFVVLDSLPSSESIQCNFDFHPTNLLIGISLYSSSFCEWPFYFDYHKT